MKGCGIFMGFFFLTFHVCAQLLPVKIYTAKDGLSSDAVQSILQDSRGILWFGTNNGVNWYDGSHIISPAMISKSGQIFVNDLYEDKQHNIWVCSFYSGLYKFDGKNFRNYLPDSLRLESTCNNIFKIVQINDSDYLVASDCGAYIFNGSFTPLDKNNPLLFGQINIVAVTPDNEILVVKEKGILHYHFSNGQWKFQRTLFEGYSINDLLVVQKECWIATNNGLYNVNVPELMAKGEHSTHYLEGKPVNHLFKDTKGDVWAGSDKLYKINGGQVTTYDKENGFPTGNIQAGCMDVEGNLWLASQNGVFKLNNEFYRFFDLSILNKDNNNPGIDPRDSIITTLRRANENKIDYIFYLSRDHNGRFFAGTSAGLFDVSGNKFIKIGAFTPRSAYEDENGNTWIGTQSDQIIRFKNNTFYPIKSQSNLADIPQAIFMDQYGFLWIGFATTGIRKYRMSGDSMIQVKEYSYATGFPNIRTRCFINDKKGHLIFGTRTNGIIEIPVADTNQQPHVINANNGLPATWIRKMILDDNGNILLTSNNGLYELGTNDYQHPKIRLIPFVNDKVPVELGDIYKDGRSYLITTLTGIIQYFPSLQKQNDIPPAVYLTKVNIDGKPDTSFSPYSAQNEVLHLPSQSNNISLEFTATSFTVEASILYRYILEGADKDWGPPVKTNSINYSHLKPGHYTFKVMAANNDGIWSLQPATITFIIASPFWQRWWFIILSVIFIAAILYFIYRYRMRQLLNFQKLRTNISTDLHDDIGSTLSSISILSDMAMRQKKPEDAGEMVNEIKQNSLSLMERMDDIVWSINPKNDTLENLLVRVRDFAAQLFEARDIDYTIEIEEGIKLVKLPMEYRQHIYLILKEAINNMVKYAECTKATVRVAYLHGNLDVVVEDNGKGFDVSQQSGGNGLFSIRRRSALMNARVEINSSPFGTKIHLRVKIK